MVVDVVANRDPCRWMRHHGRARVVVVDIIRSVPVSKN